MPLVVPQVWPSLSLDNNGLFLKDFKRGPLKKENDGRCRSQHLCNCEQSLKVGSDEAGLITSNSLHIENIVQKYF